MASPGTKNALLFHLLQLSERSFSKIFTCFEVLHPFEAHFYCSLWFSLLLHMSSFPPFLAIEIFYELSLCLQIFLFGTNSFKSPGTIPFLLKSIKAEQFLVPVIQDTFLDPRELFRVGQLSVSFLWQSEEFMKWEQRWYLPWYDWAECVWLQHSWTEWAYCIT